MKAIPQALAASAVAAAMAGAGCQGGPGPAATECGASLLPGDLVITEIMANPIGQSDGKKWVEVYNASSAPIDLEGIHIVSGGNTRHVMGSLVMEPGAYAVLGGVLPEFLEDYHDYAYADEIDLPGSGGDIAIACGAEEIDAATYPGMSSGVAMGLDGGIAPDHTANDDPGNWCEAEQTFAPDGSRGTPGRSNDACGAVSQDTCNDGGSQRELVPPQPGDLVITEVMGKPADGLDSSLGDWFEVYVARDVDLNGVQLGQYGHETDEDPGGPEPVAQTLASRDCLRHEAGTHIVLAGSDDPEVNGGLPQVDYVIDFGRSNLTQTDGGVFVGFNDEIFDYVTWEGDPWGGCDSTTPQCGFALNLDPTRRTPEESSDPNNWCFAGDVFSPKGRGTPGLSNGTCLPGGPCVDEGGQTRNAVPPEPGDLVITEVMPSEQDGIDHTNGEWFELLVTGDQGVDLNALQLGQFKNDETSPREIEHTVVRRDCLRHEPGSYVLFARSDDPELNGGLEAVDYVFNFGYYTLSNTNGGLYLTVGNNLEELLEVVTWTSADSGVSLNLDPAFFTPEGSRNLDNWCDADATSLEPYFSCLLDEVQYEDEDGEIQTEIVCGDEGTAGEAFSYGTPATENPSCPQ